MSMLLANDLIKQISGDDAKKYFKTTFDNLQEKLLYNLVILGKYIDYKYWLEFLNM